MKKLLVAVLAIVLTFTMVACKGNKKSEVDKIIAEAETMTLDELMAKAYEESNGKTLEGIGNSSRGKTAGEAFILAMKAKYPDYTGTINWQQPKENSIFQMLDADSKSPKPVFSMTLIQDGSQIQSKMVDTKILKNFIPKEFRESQGVNLKNDGSPLTLQLLNKVFMFNNQGEKTFDNVWDFVKQGERPMFMGLESEPVGFNFLLMLTKDEYANVVKSAFDALDATDKAYFQTVVDSVAAKAKEFKLGENGKYSLAWIKLFVQQMNEKTDDGPIMNDLAAKSAAGQTGLIVYSKLRSVEETASSSVNNVTVAAYQEGYKGFGGYGYKHFLQITDNSPLPWTALAFISFMVTEKAGFQPWGKDMGGYSANPALRTDHTKDGYVEENDILVNKFPAKNDRGFDWWTNMGADGGRLIIEDPVYAAKVSFTIGEWILSLQK